MVECTHLTNEERAKLGNEVDRLVAAYEDENNWLEENGWEPFGDKPFTEEQRQHYRLRSDLLGAIEYDMSKLDYDPSQRHKMPTPPKSVKSPALIEFYDKVLSAAGHQTKSHAAATQTCVSCNGPATEFRDDISRKEYGVSGLCQICQDKVFSDDDEE